MADTYENAYPKKVLSVHATQCCGMQEINNLSACETPGEALREVMKRMNNMLFKNAAILLFSGVVELTAVKKLVKYTSIGHPHYRDDNYGQAFADYITANQLGTVTPSNIVRNPVSGNMIRVWMWEPNYEAIKALIALDPPPVEPKPNE